MEGPNINKCFQNKLEGELQCKGKRLVSVGTCILHIVFNIFVEGLKSLLSDIDLNHFVKDLHSFFRHSLKQIY